MKNVYLHTILPKIKIDYTRYMRSEEQIEHALAPLGWKVTGRWRTTERDSFGPLIRSVNAVDPNGNPSTLWYG